MKRILLLIVLICFLFTGNASAAVILSEDWESGYLDGNTWSTYGSPTPQVVGFGDNSNYSLNNNGNSSNWSWIAAKESLNLSEGNISISASLKHAPITAAHHMRSFFGLATPGGTNYFTFGGGQVGVDCNTLPGYDQSKFSIAGSGYLEVPVVDQDWHDYQVKYFNDGYAEMYMDDRLVLKGQSTINTNYDYQFAYGGKAAYGPMTIDNIVVEQGDGFGGSYYSDHKPIGAMNLTNNSHDPDFEYSIPDIVKAAEEWGYLYIRNHNLNEKSYDWALSPTSSEFEFDPNKDTVVIVHGWNREDTSANPEWVESLADAYAERSDKDGNYDANVLVWNWQVVASGQSDDSVPDLSIPGEALNLSRELLKLFGEDYSGDIQLIGHSLGAGVAARTAAYMNDAYNDFGYNIERLTLFDAPNEQIGDYEAHTHLEKVLPYVGDALVENYISEWGTGYNGGVNINNVHLTKFNEIDENAPKSDISDQIVNKHSFPQYWYTQTVLDINNNLEAGFNYNYFFTPDADNLEQYVEAISSSGYEFDLYHPADGQSFLLRNTSQNMIDNYSDLKWFQDDPILSQSDLDFYSSGDAWAYDGRLYAMTHSPVFIYSTLDIPEGDVFLSFDLTVHEWNEGDLFALYCNDTLLLSFLTDFLGLENALNILDIDLSQWAGTLSTLSFGLIAQGEGVNSIFSIGNINLYADASNTAPVPEPSTIVLMGLGLVGLAGLSRKKVR